MHKFSQFDLRLNIRKLPLTYSLGDLSTIREIFTPENGDIGRTQLPNFPPISEAFTLNGDELEGYLVKSSPALMVAIKNFLQASILHLEFKNERKTHQESETIQRYVDIRRECMMRIGTRLVELIKQERRLGLFNLFWIVTSKYVVNLLEHVISERGEKKHRLKLTMISLVTQAFQETFEQVMRYFQKYDVQKRQYSQFIDETLTSHLGAAFNHEFARAIIMDQVHVIFPMLNSKNVLDCAQAIFLEENEKYHISYEEFFDIYAGIRTYIERQLSQEHSGFCDKIATLLRISRHTVRSIPLEALTFHPAIITLFAEEFKHLPAKNARRRKTFFKSRPAQLGAKFGEEYWEFAINDYVTFAKDLRRSEIIIFLRRRVKFLTAEPQTAENSPNTPVSAEFADKISYQFDQGRIINDLRNVTLIFLDLRGFTKLSAGDISDRQLKEHLYNFFDPAVNILNHFNGTIKTYAGDGILASFGGQKDHALNAVRAAIEIQKLFHRLKQVRKIAFTGMGIGIHTGIVEETYFFPDLESPSHNTVIGLTANLVGRLSSGKAEKKGRVNQQSIASLHEYLQAQEHDGLLDRASVAIFEDQLLLALDALEQENTLQSIKEELGPKSPVRVVRGMLNNNGIAISNITFKHLHALQPLQEQEFQGKVTYSYFDEMLQEHLLLRKAGDALFKGIAEKFPVWGIFPYRKSSASPHRRQAASC